MRGTMLYFKSTMLNKPSIFPVFMDFALSKQGFGVIHI